MSELAVPNPGWWTQKPTVYEYSGSGRHQLIGRISFFACIVGQSAWHSDWLLFAGLFFLAYGMFVGRAWEDRGGLRVETRFNHITVLRGEKVLEHEDVRDLASLDPVYSSRNGKLKYYVAKFSTGHEIKLFHNLENLDELLNRLRGNLPA